MLAPVCLTWDDLSGDLSVLLQATRPPLWAGDNSGGRLLLLLFVLKSLCWGDERPEPVSPLPPLLYSTSMLEQEASAASDPLLLLLLSEEEEPLLLLPLIARPDRNEASRTEYFAPGAAAEGGAAGVAACGGR